MSGDGDCSVGVASTFLHGLKFLWGHPGSLVYELVPAVLKACREEKTFFLLGGAHTAPHCPTKEAAFENQVFRGIATGFAKEIFVGERSNKKVSFK